MPGNSPAPLVPDRSCVWLVHPVGLADLGVNGACDARSEQARLAELQAAADRQDLDRLWDLLWHGRYHRGAEAPARSVHTHRDLPLPKLMRGLASPGADVRRARVLLVAATTDGARFAGLRMSDLSRCLCHAVTAVHPRIHRETGSVFEIVDVGCALPSGLGEDTVCDELVVRHQALGPDAPGRVMISWGSGAMSTSFSAASTAVRLGLPWQLLDYTALNGNTAVPADPLDAVDPTQPLAVPYLTRLRLFHELALLAGADADGLPQVPFTAEQERAVQAMVDLVDRGYRAEDAEALRQVSWEALVRRDGTAGFALRRYVIARYHAMCESLGVERAEPEKKGRSKGRRSVPQLGDLREVAEQLSAADPTHRPNAWLASSEIDVVNRFGSAAHDLKLSDAQQAEQIARWMVQWDGLSLAEADLVTQFGIRPATGPAGGLLAVWAVGMHGDDGRASVAHHLLHEGPGTEVEQFLGSNRFPLRALLLATAASRAGADKQREELTPAEPRDIKAMVQFVGLDFHDRPLVRSQIRVYLSEILAKDGDTIGGLLLVPTGPKPIVLAALQEMFRVSAERAIPLFVRDTADDGTSLGRLHLWPAAVGHDRPLLTTALAAFDRLELDAAARLLAGTTRAEDLAVQCNALARAFTGRDDDWRTWNRQTTRVPADGWVTRGRLAQRLELVDHCASSLDVGSGQNQAGRDRNALLTRFLVLAATLVENWKPLLSPVDDNAQKKGNKWRLLDQTSKDPADPAQGHAAVLLTLRTARNKIPITHAHAPDAEHAVKKAIEGLKHQNEFLPDPWPKTGTSLAFLHAAPTAVAPWDLPAASEPPLLDRYHELRRRIVQACVDAGATPEKSS
jgi:hypothetical protein